MKTYLYSDLINENFQYSIDNEGIVVYKNCDNNNNCTCEKVFTNNNYLRSEPYTCSYTNITPYNYNNLSSDFSISNDFDKILIILLIFSIFIILIPIKIILRFFKRFSF